MSLHRLSDNCLKRLAMYLLDMATLSMLLLKVVKYLKKIYDGFIRDNVFLLCSLLSILFDLIRSGQSLNLGKCYITLNQIRDKTDYAQYHF